MRLRNRVVGEDLSVVPASTAVREESREAVELREVVIPRSPELTTRASESHTHMATGEENAPSAPLEPSAQTPEEEGLLSDARKRAADLAAGRLPPRRGYSVDPDTGAIR